MGSNKRESKFFDYSQLAEFLQSIDIKQVIDSIGLNRRGQAFQCPAYYNHNNDDRKLSAYCWQLPSGKWIWKCFGCGVKGDVIDLLKIAYGFTFKQTLDFLLDRSIFLKANNKSKNDLIPRPSEIEILAMTELVKTLSVGRYVKIYAETKKISLDTLEKYRVGQLTKESYKILSEFEESLIERLKLKKEYESKRHNVIIFPVIDLNGNVQSFQMRYIDKGKVTRFFKTVFSQQYAFGHHLLTLKRPIMLCEGPSDALSAFELGFVGLGIFGVNQLPPNTINILKDRKIYLALDNDQAGVRQTQKLITSFKKWKHFLFPSNFKDLNEYMQYLKSREAKWTMKK